MKQPVSQFQACQVSHKLKKNWEAAMNNTRNNEQPTTDNSHLKKGLPARNEVKAGYKKTEIGIIPEKWKAKSLGDISVDMLQGVNTAIDIPEYVKKGIPMLKANDVIDGNINFNFADQISIRTYRSYNKRFKPKKGDFLFSNIGARLGSGALLRKDIECSFAWNVMRIIPNIKIIIPEYLNSAINSPTFFNLVISNQTGSGMGFVPKNILQNLKIPLPPLPEQTAIATVLSDTDNLIQSLEKLIAKKRLIKQGAMQKLLKPDFQNLQDDNKLKEPINHNQKSSNQENQINQGSNKWEVKKLGEIAEFYKGKGLPKSDISLEGKYQCIHYGELFTKYQELISGVVSRTNNNNNCFLSKENDVLMPTSDVTPNGLATASCINENNIILGGDILVIRISNKIINGIYLSYFITQNRKQVMQLVTGSTVYHLYGSDMSKFQLSFPVLEKQTRIATILSDMDNETEALESKLAKYKNIKQGLMQVLLTGKIRMMNCE